MARILSGERLSKRVLSHLKKKRKKGLTLAVLQVGKNAVSEKYIAEKRKAASFLGVAFRLVKVPSSVSQRQLTKRIAALGRDKKISGMIIQLPLPPALNTQEVLDGIPSEKDVDVLSSASFSDFALGRLSVLPPTVGAISMLLHETKKPLEETRVAVVGAGRLVGLPVALWAAQQGAQISLIQKGTRNAARVISKADIVISGVGKPGLITGKMVKKGAVVIDAGTSVEGGSTKGDVDFESVSKKASFLTPVPGGVGPLTVACLFYNLFSLHG
ncbi:MAG: bifunctional 5,10-methylenetetrahydrofolate dehydrogenase/5,10-methenyltetrahydrofolate cyclohydrolase [bacterium]|nr:bifunctional 5,10-methylenetetrahydrofolate dehydrogenase/5,10-methenyltetrahydrofolate cyclohydrolase [bacterium]